MSQNTTLTTFEADLSTSSSRTVFDIFWSCLFTIFACTWTAQHLNVPEQRGGRDAGWKGDIRWALKGIWMSTKWMIITVLAPEVLITLNGGQLVNTLKLLPQLKAFAEEDGVPWTLTHSLFADMGGLVVRSYSPERCLSFHGWEVVKNEQVEIASGGQDKAPQNPDAKHQIDITQTSPRKDANVAQKPTHNPATIYLSSVNINLLRSSHRIKMPYLTTEEITSFGTTDSFARLITISQLLWIIIQMVVRATRHLEISQLEIGTVAFACCASIIYGLNWYKPKGVTVPWTLHSYPGSLPVSFNEILEEEEVQNDWLFTKILGPANSADHSFVPNHHRPKIVRAPETKSRHETEGFIFSTTLFGAIHFGAVGATFPSHIEKILWYCASGVCTGITAILFVYLITMVVLSLADDSSKVRRLCFRGGLALIVLLYVVARLYLLVELFRCLWFLAPSALVGTWAEKVPHVS